MDPVLSPRSGAGMLIRMFALISAFTGTISRLVLSLDGFYGYSILGYFTIQSNLMVCLFLAADSYAWLRGKNRVTPMFHGAILLYILITGLVYNLLLAANVQSSGFDLLVLNINHGITPLLFLLDWLFNRRRERYPLSFTALWLIYPVLYGLGASIEGMRTGRFRYFFLNFQDKSVPEYLAEIGLVTGFFILFALLIIIVHNALVHKLNSTRS